MILKPLTKVLLFLFMISLVGFTVITNEENKEDFPVNYEEQIVNENNTETFIETELIDYINKGEMVVSWYGPRFHGRRTANGEIYNQMAFTAAHKKLGFGTLLRVTNPENSKSVIVRINDRGPYIRGRQLDISKGAAIELGMIEKGVAKMEIEQLSLKGVNFPILSLN